MMQTNNHSFLSSVISLFTASGTLICCALPALFVSIGAGAALAGLVSSAPWLVTLTQYKGVIFGFAAIALIIAGIMQYRARFLPCPLEQNKAITCSKLRKISLYVYIFAVIIYLIGGFFSFFAVYFL